MKSKPNRGATKFLARLILPLAFIAMASYALYRWCYLPYKCNIFEKTAEQTMLLTEDAISSPRATTIARQNLQDTLVWIARCPHDLDLRMIAAASFRQLGRSDEAIGMYRAALMLDRRPEIYLNLGQSEAEANRIDDAVPPLAAAVMFDPALISEVPATLQQRVRDFVRSKTGVPI